MRQEGPHRLMVRGFVQRAGGDRVQALQFVAEWIATLTASDDIDTLFMIGSEFGVRSRELLSADERRTAIPENVDPGANPIFSASMAEEMRVALTEAITRVVDEEIDGYRRAVRRAAP